MTHQHGPMIRLRSIQWQLSSWSSRSEVYTIITDKSKLHYFRMFELNSRMRNSAFRSWWKWKNISRQRNRYFCYKVVIWKGRNLQLVKKYPWNLPTSCELFRFRQNFRNIGNSFVQGGIIQPGTQLQNANQAQTRQTRSSNITPIPAAVQPDISPVKVRAV